GRAARGRRAVPHEPQGNAVGAAAAHGGAAGGGAPNRADERLSTARHRRPGRAADLTVVGRPGGGHGRAGLRDTGRHPAAQGRRARRAVRAGRAGDGGARVGEAVLRWEGEGYRTHRLEALLQRDAPAAVDDAIAAFAGDVERLKALEAEVADLDPQAAGQSVFRDPERLREAEEAAAKV